MAVYRQRGIRHGLKADALPPNIPNEKETAMLLLLKLWNDLEEISETTALMLQSFAVKRPITFLEATIGA